MLGFRILCTSDPKAPKEVGSVTTAGPVLGREDQQAMIQKDMVVSLNRGTPTI